MSLEFFDQGKKYVGGADDNICPICHEDLNETQVTIMCHECGQKFHHECIKEWCTTSSGYTNQKGCPSCRDPNICTNNNFEAERLEAQRRERERLREERIGVALDALDAEFNMTQALEVLRLHYREYSMEDGTDIGRARIVEANREFTQMENHLSRVWDWMLNHLMDFFEDLNVPFPNQNIYEEPNEQSERTDNARSLLQEIEDNPNWFRTPRLNNSKDVAHLCDLYDLMIINWEEYDRLEGIDGYTIGGYFTELFGRPFRFLFREEQNIYAQRIRAQRIYKSLQVKIFIFTMILQNRDTHTREQVNNADRGAQTDDDLGPVMPATLEREQTQMEAPREQTLTAAEAVAIAAQIAAEEAAAPRRRGRRPLTAAEADAIAAQIVAERRERDRHRGAQTNTEAGIDVQIAELNAQIDAERNRRDAAEMRIAEANMRTAEAERRIADAERRIADMGISGGKPKKRTYKKRTYKKRTYKKKTKQLFGWGKNPKLEKFWRELASGKKVIIVYNNDKIENYNMPKTKNAAHKKYIELLNNNEIKAIITSGQSSDIYEALYKRVKNKSPQEIIKNYKKYLWQYESGEKEYYL
tara:strand:+ start:17285 stop:19039 length:1755 start_codon:yes stop_codon:yes gene_type:complete